MSDAIFNGSAAIPSGASSGSSVEQLNGEVYSSGSLASDSLNYSDGQAAIIENSSGSFTSSITGTQDAETLMSYGSGSIYGLETFNNNFVTLNFVIIILLSAIFGTLLFSLLKDFFK